MAIDLDNSPVTIIPGITGLMNSRRPLGGLELSALPFLPAWETAMESEGHTNAAIFDPLNYADPALVFGDYYYDAAWCFYQIGDYLGETEPWATYAENAIAVYRDGYLTPNDYETVGKWRFAHGMYESYARGGSVTQLELQKMRDNPTDSSTEPLLRTYGAPIERGYSQHLSREIAYSLQSNVLAERAGVARITDSDLDMNVYPKNRVEYLVGFMENHLKEWITQTFALTVDVRFAPFMFGLTANSLIEFYEWEEENSRNPNAYWPTTNWPNIIAALEDVATWMVNEAEVVGTSQYAGLPMYDFMFFAYDVQDEYPYFRYQDRYDEVSGDATPAPDLNTLISSVYAWLYLKTGNLFYRNVHDLLFAGGHGARGIYLQGKHFNQNLRYTFRALNWRAQADTAWYGG